MTKGQYPPGEQFEGYRLLRLLGRGSFGKVYLAQHLLDHTQVAIKQLLMPVSDKGVWKEFLNEARSIRLQHPHILPLLNFGVSSDEYPYLVMEYAPGGSVRAFTKKQPLPFELVARYTLHMASALQYAHDRRLVHRDVKPENMLLRADGTLLLSDFGISRLMDQGSLPRAVSLAGTPAYMAPEQGMGYPCAASDQYALAVVVYEWLTGHHLFNGSALQVAIQHRLDPPPSPRTHLPEISPQVEQVVMRALSKGPTERFPTVMLFAQDLQQALSVGLSRSTNSHASITKNVSSPSTISSRPQRAEESSAATKSQASGRDIVLADPPVDKVSEQIESTHSTRSRAKESGITSRQKTPPAPPARPRWRLGLLIVLLLVLLVGGGSASVLLLQTHLSSQTRGTTASHPNTVSQQKPPSQQSTVPPLSSPTATPIPTNTPMPHPTTATAPATATSIAPRPAASPFGVPTGWHHVFNDPMTAKQHNSGWMQGIWKFSSCLFSDSYYEETSTGSNYCVYGTLDTPTDVLSDLFYQLDVAWQSGTEVGMVFRNTNNSYYYFAIDDNGNVHLETHNPASGGIDNPLYTGTSSAIHQGQGQWNTLAVLARGSSLALYINQSLISTITDTTYVQGLFGVAVNGPDAQNQFGDGRFKNATVWVP